jgi:hypothetical protein
MTAIEDLLQVLQLLPGFIAMFEQLVKSLGSKDQALLVTMAALAHPELKPAVLVRMQAALNQAHQAL